MGEQRFEVVCQRCGTSYTTNIKWTPELYRELDPKHDCLHGGWSFNAKTSLKGDQGETYTNA